ncbi:MAG: tyrosine-type recombinase/integrase, partial [Syntrophobacteraceae bacterium]|nr:tyrosine-type recombinase/integrase [Syntrophobacteraceae bacterium]
RNGIWYVEYSRSNAQSLKTRDKKEAERRFKVLEREAFLGNLVKLEAEVNISLKDFTAEYLARRASMSKKTIAHDALSLKKLAEAIGPETSLRLIDIKKIEDFKIFCHGQGLKPDSINSYLRQIKAALSSAEDWGYVSKRPKIKMVPGPKHLPRYLRPEEIKTLLAKADELRPEFARMLRFFLWTGARRNEALGLTWEDCSLKGKKPYVTLTGKGDKQRNVPVLPPLMDVLKPLQKDVGKVFPPINESTATHWFKQLARACRPPIEARLHDLRHTAATYMLANGVPIRIVQEILGHAQLSTTAIYAEVVKDQVHQEMTKLKFDFE